MVHKMLEARSVKIRGTYLMRLSWFLLTLLSFSGCVIDLDEEADGETQTPTQQLDGGTAGMEGDTSPPNSCPSYEEVEQCQTVGCYWSDGACFDEVPPHPHRCEDLPDQETCEVMGCSWWPEQGCSNASPPPISCDAYGSPEACEADPNCQVDFIDGACDCEDCDCGEGWACAPRREEPPRACEDYDDPDACEQEPSCYVEFIDSGCSCPPGEECDCGEGWICLPETDTLNCDEMMNPQECEAHPGCIWNFNPCICPDGGPNCECEDPWGFCAVDAPPPVDCRTLWGIEACEEIPGCGWVWLEDAALCDSEDCDYWDAGICLPDEEIAGSCIFLGAEACAAEPACGWVEEGVDCSCPGDDSECVCPAIARAYCASRELSCEELEFDLQACNARPDCFVDVMDPGCGPGHCPEDDPDCECDADLHFCATRPAADCSRLALDLCEEQQGCHWITESCVCDPDGTCDDCTHFSYCAPEFEPRGCHIILDEGQCQESPGCAWLPPDPNCNCPEDADCDCWDQGHCVEPPVHQTDAP